MCTNEIKRRSSASLRCRRSLTCCMTTTAGLTAFPTCLIFAKGEHPLQRSHELADVLGATSYGRNGGEINEQPRLPFSALLSTKGRRFPILRRTTEAQEKPRQQSRCGHPQPLEFSPDCRNKNTGQRQSNRSRGRLRTRSDSACGGST